MFLCKASQRCPFRLVLLLPAVLMLIANLARAQGDNLAPHSMGFESPLPLSLPLYRALLHLYDIWTPLVNHLDKVLKHPVRLRTLASLNNTVPKILLTRPEYVFVNPWQYVLLHAQGGSQSFSTGFRRVIRVSDSTYDVTRQFFHTLGFGYAVCA